MERKKIEYKRMGTTKSYRKTLWGSKLFHQLEVIYSH